MHAAMRTPLFTPPRSDPPCFAPPTPAAPHTRQRYWRLRCLQILGWFLATTDADAPPMPPGDGDPGSTRDSGAPASGGAHCPGPPASSEFEYFWTIVKPHCLLELLFVQQVAGTCTNLAPLAHKSHTRRGVTAVAQGDRDAWHAHIRFGRRIVNLGRSFGDRAGSNIGSSTSRDTDDWPCYNLILENQVGKKQERNRHTTPASTAPRGLPSAARI
jgi:hypothetical protein